ncbi:3-oxoacid CoA-transferase subunit B [Geopsychrobacter electrodiphilus]|uniref:3-oxoacid CoA-transferase subunit B n=1 Tax=Geopsychrobacter electrodiphilus TaxID=225196 RepID=UPI000369589B|nr:3-oxoacid CoA-transferase subunit B [Geopsychrobacter electrodiphilus]
MSTRTKAVIGLSRKQMAWRAAQDVIDCSYVNLGIGIPEQIANYVPEGRTVIYHTENGILGFGPSPEKGQEDPELINAGKKPVTLLPGASFFHQADSFAMMRGGHIDMCFLGALQVSYQGDLANWSTGEPGAIPAVGGAMDLVAGVKRVLVLTDHMTRDGRPKLVSTCTYPLTCKQLVERVYTNYGVFDIAPEGFIVREIAPGVTTGLLEKCTAAPLLFPDDLILMEPPEQM